ncbi:MAG: 4-phosphoerythronate dehydrogenase [Ignavibacteriaceae bacterium]|jgi:erythronate-4-phosphate dehydrogenase|nr:4-phosphoerythronate dehydrogenase [Ignavibacteriaceae bacterium]MCW8813246.1 4-phosphoerythronate dehydrogenase [Chlorobium sp.]MCW8818203.1 4-phosphoerythronate dehydrogenase [Ignavibacteriaceae bacterium]MCW8961733.1 4-phosphoerythronate dehydrogenase [Ignavibacteriaceae bacterium]
MKLIVDENIAFAKEAFLGFGNLRLLNGRSITNTEVKDADVIIVRSITQVDEKLLKNSKVKFIGTTTIGTDHIDLEYLENNNIKFADAKGCNADSVAEYVFTALLKVVSEEQLSLGGKTIGVVGVGNIGSKVVRLAESFGMKVLKNDPPLERKSIGKNYVPLDEILKADIITLHVPLTLEGVDKTHHLLNKENFKKIKSEALIINTARGAAIDNDALLKESSVRNFKLILDVWEDEPSINIRLLKETKVGTAHIAGYSLEGKVNGTKMIYDSFCKYYNREPAWKPELPKIEQTDLRIPEGKTDEEKLYKLFFSIYDIEKDDSQLRNITTCKQNRQAAYFDKLRKEYPVRREFNNYNIRLSNNETHFKPILESFRFKVKSD